MADDSKDPQALAEGCARRMYEKDRAIHELGMTVHNVSPGAAETRMAVSDAFVNGHGICHGGYIFSLADTAFAYACNSFGTVTVAAGASIDFLRPARSGDKLVAIARAVHSGRRRGVYDVEVRTAEGRLIAVFRGRAAALPVAAQSDTQ